MSYYDELGVSKDASKEDIKRAYRKLAMKFHPDKGGDPEKFKRISEAYETLSDDDRRNQYDNHNPFSGVGGGSGHEDVMNFFNSMFNQGGGGGGGTRKMNDVVHDMEIPLERAYHGADVKFKVTLDTWCTSCTKRCDYCKGSGFIQMGIQIMMIRQPCPNCSGNGVLHRGCTGCTRGTVPVDKLVQVRIPQWCEDGHQFVLEGFGHQKVKSSDVSGNLVIRIRVKPDPNFERVGRSLIFRPTISFVESLIGMPLVVPHFDGTTVVDTRQFGVIDPTRVYEVPEKSLKIAFKIRYPTRPWTSDESASIRELFDLKIKNV